MAQRLLERCPECETYLSNALSRSFWNGDSDYKNNFDWVCGGCGAELEIEVEAIPQFYCTLKAGTMRDRTQTAVCENSAANK